ncbi:MAG: hypothetical protein IPL41_08185 [Micropruina sp.]|nr:hypothetical protein [Micropruina sp.]
MDNKQKTGLAIGGAVIAAGAVFGVSYALGSSSGGSDTAQAVPTAQSTESGRPGGGGGGGMGTSELASALAEKLDADETKITEAIQAVMGATRPSGAPSGRPTDGGQPPSDADQPGDGTQPSARPSTGGDRSGMDATLAKAIAEKLGIDEAKVTNALQEVRAEQQAGRSSTTASPQPSASATA